MRRGPTGHARRKHSIVRNQENNEYGKLAMMELILYFAVVCCALNSIVGQFADNMYSVNNQSDLEHSLEQLRKNAAKMPPDGTPRNITILMAAYNYTLDIPEFVHVLNLTNGDTLTMEGPNEGSAPDAAIISCVHYNMSSNDDLIVLKNASFSDASRIVYSGISFTRCQAPLRIENVLTVIVENCIFE